MVDDEFHFFFFFFLSCASLYAVELRLIHSRCHKLQLNCWFSHSKTKTFLIYFSLPAQPQVNTYAPGTPLSFASVNPPHILASTVKSTQIYLNCHVVVKIEKSLRAHLKAVQIIEEKRAEDNEEGEKEDDLDDVPRNIEEIQKEYRKQSEIYQQNKPSDAKEKVGADLTASLLKPKKVKSRARRSGNGDADDVEEDEESDEAAEVSYEQVLNHYRQQYQRQNNSIAKRKTIPTRKGGKVRRKRSARSPFIYEWFKDDNSVVSSLHDDNPAINGFTLLPNGTLKFPATNLTAGEYRCRAKYVDEMAKFEIGPIVSMATVVELASKCFMNNFRLKFPSLVAKSLKKL